MKRMTILIVLAALIVAEPAVASVPEQMSFQGVLTDGSGGLVPDGSYTLTFRWWDAAGPPGPVGSMILGPQTLTGVQVTHGVFSVILPTSGIALLSFCSQYWLSIAVGDASAPELAPRLPLTSSPYSLSTRSICLPYGAGASSLSYVFNISNSNTASSVSAIEGDIASTTPGGFSAGIRGNNQGTGGNGIGVYGSQNGSGWGVYGFTPSGRGVFGNSTSGVGVFAQTSSTAANAYALEAINTATIPGTSSAAVRGINSGTDALNTGVGVWGSEGDFGAGVFGFAPAGNGVQGQSASGNGIYGFSSTGMAGRFVGNVTITGNLTVSGSVSKGSGMFKIDHPLDPANRYLSHSFVESSDMLDLYEGSTVLDANGTARVTMPDWFQALNRDFNYQLTPIGAPAPGLFVAEEMRENGFTIGGGKPGQRVCWQVSGIRHDATALAHRVRVEEDKPPQERGLYLDPQAFGLPASRAIGRVVPIEPSQPLSAAQIRTTGRK